MLGGMESTVQCSVVLGETESIVQNECSVVWDVVLCAVRVSCG